MYCSCCEVHLEGSKAHEAQNHGVVHPSKKTDDNSLIQSLFNHKISLEDFNKQVSKLKKEFPKATKWIDLYLHEQRCSLIFPVFEKFVFSVNGNNKNGQESQEKII